MVNLSGQNANFTKYALVGLSTGRPKPKTNYFLLILRNRVWPYYQYEPD